MARRILAILIFGVLPAVAAAAKGQVVPQVTAVIAACDGAIGKQLSYPFDNTAWTMAVRLKAKAGGKEAEADQLASGFRDAVVPSYLREMTSVIASMLSTAFTGEQLASVAAAFGNPAACKMVYGGEVTEQEQADVKASAHYGQLVQYTDFMKTPPDRETRARLDAVMKKYRRKAVEELDDRDSQFRTFGYSSRDFGVALREMPE